MTFLSALGEFPEMLLGLAFSFACALLLGFVCLRFLVGLMTRQQYTAATDHNVSDASRIAVSRIDAASRSDDILWLDAAVAGANAGSDARPLSHRDGGGTGGPYVLSAAAPVNHLARNTEPDVAAGGRVVELPQLLPEGVTEIGYPNGGDAA